MHASRVGKSFIKPLIFKEKYAMAYFLLLETNQILNQADTLVGSAKG
jgi:hypothetical protein